MFGHVARLAARPATAAAAATVAANVAQGPAQARAPPAQGAVRQVAHPATTKFVDRDTDGWVLAELENEVVLFRPFETKELDEAASTVMHLWAGRSDGSGPSSAPAFPFSGPIVDEPADDEDISSASSSSGSAADAVIEAACAGSSEAGWGVSRERQQLEGLMTITKRLLRRPGLQREVVQCMLEDEEVRELMLRECSDLDRYLLAAGIPNPPLLLAPPGAEGVAAADGAPSPSTAGDAGAARPDLVSRLVGVVAGALERAGDALASLGGWLRRHVAAAFGQPLEEDAEEVEEIMRQGAASGGAKRPQRTADQVMGGVMVLAVAVFCVAVIRRPLVLRAVSRR